jgi:hypothetical protein
MWGIYVQFSYDTYTENKNVNMGTEEHELEHSILKYISGRPEDEGTS